MSCSIYLIRHGKTEWNVLGKMQGQVNIPLNDTGIKQAQAAALRLEHISFDICYTSPLCRARETARIVLGKSNTPIIDQPLLLEQSYGLSEGALQSTGYHDPASPIYGYASDPEHYKPDTGAESFPDIMDRGRQVIEELILPLDHTYKTVLIAAHGAILCAVLNNILKKPIRQFWETKLDNCGIAHIQLENGCLETDWPKQY